MGIVTLVSGGLDSTLMSMLIREEGVPLFPLFIDYGQLAVSREWEACKRLHYCVRFCTFCVLVGQKTIYITE